ncbi:PEP-CTERM sorting domain-containing protein [Tuwongella immobilis]|uniref:: VPEP n=1 Tax=Tuwongella immobilis TaxID=692036 RepID=A0A6C2YRA8_9BACT|nr:PEP-CTERM sorting domain-containing protein [Tuwongella immobilis]VIP03643.1 : VPEP [Tuwongella immobilis]VTS04654.1 : VPEP [Tuwongella immobilis]
MRIRTSIRVMWLSLLTLAGLTLSTAHAGLLPISVNVTPDGGSFQWTYNVVLQTDSSLRPGDYFTIYDFAGYVPGTNSQPANFTFSSALEGPTPPRLLPDDDPTITNLTWTYTGPVIPAGDVLLGSFTIFSTYELKKEGFFTAQSHQSVGGQVDRNITNTEIPVPSEVPEPATLALLGLGAPLLAWMRKRQERRSQPTPQV